MLSELAKERIRDLVATGELDNLDTVLDSIYEDIKEIVKGEAYNQGIEIKEINRPYYVFPTLKGVE